MLKSKINYYSHLLLNSKYKFFINLIIILTLYSMFYGNTISFCMNQDSNIIAVPVSSESKTISDIKPIGDIFELERIRVHEKIIAYTHKEPEQLLAELDVWKIENRGTIATDASQASLEKQYLENIMPKIHKHQAHRVAPDEEGARKAYYLIRLYRRLMTF